MTDKKILKVNRQAVELAKLHVEASLRAGRKPDPGMVRIATAKPNGVRDASDAE